jgi:hypothetical protein
MRYRIESTGAEILADLEFVEQYYPGDFTEVAEAPPVAKRVITALAFRSRFTQAEKQAIYTAAKTAVDVQIWLADLAAVMEVNLDDALTAAGVREMESVGFIGVGRAAEILA